PQAQRDQDYDTLAALALTLALAAVLVDTVLLGLHAEPDAIELDDRGHLPDRFAMHLSEPSFELIDALIDGAQAHAGTERGCPFLAKLAQAPRQATVKDRMLWHIQSEKLDIHLSL